MANLKVNVPLSHTQSVMITQQEAAYYKELADKLGLTVSQLMRNCTIACMMSDDDPTYLAREQHVTALSRLDRWRQGTRGKYEPEGAESWESS